MPSAPGLRILLAACGIAFFAAAALLTPLPGTTADPRIAPFVRDLADLRAAVEAAEADFDGIEATFDGQTVLLDVADRRIGLFERNYPYGVPAEISAYGVEVEARARIREELDLLRREYAERYAAYAEAVRRHNARAAEGRAVARAAGLHRALWPLRDVWRRGRASL